MGDFSLALGCYSIDSISLRKVRFLKLIILFSLLIASIASAQETDIWRLDTSITEELLSLKITALYRVGSVLYVGTEEGLNRIDGEKVTDYDHDMGLPYARIEDITRDKRDRLWCIVDGQVYVLTRGHWFKCILEGLDTTKGRATSLEMGYRDMMIGTNRGTIYAINVREDLKLDTAEVQDTTVFDSLAMAQDSTTLDSLLREMITVKIGKWDDLENVDVIYDIAHWRRGIYYLATSNGFFRYDSEKRKPEKAGEKITTHLLTGICVEKESESAIWLAGANRLGRINLYESKLRAEVLEIQGIKAIEVDDSLGYRWCMSANALFEIYPDTLAFVKHAQHDSTVVHRLNALLTLPGGKVLLGTEKGLLPFQPGRPSISIVNLRARDVRDSSNNVWIDFEIENATAYPYLECQWTVDGVEWCERKLTAEIKNGLNLGDLEEKENYEVRVRINPPLNDQNVATATITFKTPSRLREKPSLWKRKEVWIPALVVIVLLVGLAIFIVVTRWRRKKEEVALRVQKSRLTSNPYIVGPPIIDPKYFIGRQRILNEILAGIRNNSFLIHGERRIGKTSLLYQIVHRIRALEDDKYKILPIMVNLQKFSGRRTSKNFYTNLAHEMAKAVYTKVKRDKVLEAEYDYNKFGLFMELLARNVRRRNRPKTARVILLIDEGDQMTAYGSGFHDQFRGLFQSSYAENFNVVIALREFSLEWKHNTSPWYNFFIIKKLGPMTPDETKTLIQSYVEGAVKYKTGALRLIWEKKQGHPYEVQKLCSEIYDSLGDRVYVLPKDVKRALKA